MSGRKSGSGSEGEDEGEKEETVMLNSEFKEVKHWGETCYAISGGNITLFAAGDSVKKEDTAYPTITADEVLKLAEILKSDAKEEEGVKNLSEIAMFLDGVSKRYKRYLQLAESFYDSGNRRIAISTIELSKEARDEITAFFNLPLTLKKKDLDEGVLEAEGKKEYGVNTELCINVWDAEKCKQVSTEKKMMKIRVVKREEETEMIEKEVDVPIYECPEGKVIA